MTMELIPDLPETVARECLLRASYQQFPLIGSVCKVWQREISLPDFFRHRKASGHSQELVVLSQARVDPVSELGSGKTIPTPVYRISVLEPDTGLWTELPPVTGKSKGLPLFCRLSSVGSDLVVIGGLDPVTWRTSDSVFIFSFLTFTWRNRTSMPGEPRSFFACASDAERTVVYVAGGHDEDKNALTSALMYDVAEDRWASLPDMGRERDECTAIFHGGKFHVIGGYATEEQGQFSKSAESFDITTRRWAPEAKEFLSPRMTTWPPVCAAGENGELYVCCRRDLMVLSNDTWQKVGNLPADVCNVSYVAVRRSGNLVVIGTARYGEPSVVYNWDMSSSRWVKLETQEKYVGQVQAGCFLDI